MKIELKEVYEVNSIYKDVNSSKYLIECEQFVPCKKYALIVGNDVMLYDTIESAKKYALSFINDKINDMSSDARYMNTVTLPELNMINTCAKRGLDVYEDHFSKDLNDPFRLFSTTSGKIYAKAKEMTKYSNRKDFEKMLYVLTKYELNEKIKEFKEKRAEIQRLRFLKVKFQ